MSLSNILTVTPLGALLVAAYAGWLTYRSGRDSREKLRLDLFDRRFDIYVCALSFHMALILWDDKTEQKTLIDPFIKASREARFIFPAKSGVYEFLQEFGTHAFRITHFKESMTAFRGQGGMEEQCMKLALDRADDVNWILGSLVTLENLMKPYMSFDRL